MLASSGVSPYVYNKCFLWIRRMYVCERACRYNGAVPRSSLPGRQSSGTRECLSIQGIQMETDCNISQCTFHPWREEECVKIGLSPGGKWSTALYGRHCSVGQVGLQSQSDQLALLYSSSTHQSPSSAAVQSSAEGCEVITLLWALSGKAPRKCPSYVGGRVEPALKATHLMQFSWLTIETGHRRVSTL